MTDESDKDVVTIDWEDGTYTGGISDGVPHGQGTWTSTDGDEEYVGEWKDGKEQGQGIYTSNIGTFDGEWQDGEWWTGTSYDKDGNVDSTWSEGVYQGDDHDRDIFTLVSDEDIERIRAAAIDGDRDAQFELSHLLFIGRAREEDDGEAFKWLIAAAKQGHKEALESQYAQFDLAQCYHYGQDVEQDYEEALKWYRAAAEQGHAPAQYSLADLYYTGVDVEEDFEEAAKWYHAAAEQGYAPAQSSLGRCYSSGNGVELSDETAIYWWEQAAEQGDGDAYYELAKCYIKFEGWEPVERNLQRAFEFLLPALAYSGGTPFRDEEQAFISAANEFLDDQSSKGGSQVDSRLPEDADVNELVAFCYEHGIGVEKDVERAENIREHGLEYW